MPPPLIDARRRQPAVAAILGSALVVVVLGAIFFHGGASRVDLRIARFLAAHLGLRAAELTVEVTEPALAITVLGVVVVFAALVRRFDIVALTVAGPLAAIGISSLILKPLLGRILDVPLLTGVSRYVDVRGSFPSGHETGVSSAAWVLVIVACQLPLQRRVRAALVGVLAAWVVVAAVGLVRNSYHYASDTLGGFCVATVVVLSAALLIDRWLPRHVPTRRAQRSPEAPRVADHSPV